MAGIAISIRPYDPGTDLEKLVTGDWGGSISGCQHLAALLLAFWQLGGTPMFGHAPSFLLIDDSGAARSCRNWLWETLRPFRRPLSPEARWADAPSGLDFFEGSRRRARKLVRDADQKVKQLIKQNCDYALIQTMGFVQIVPSAIHRLSSNAPLQRFWMASDPDLGSAAPCDRQVSVWVGADSQVPKLASILAKGILEGTSAISRPIIEPDRLVEMSFMGGVSYEAWSQDLAAAVLKGGSPMLALGVADSRHPMPDLDCRFSKILRLKAMGRRTPGRFARGTHPHLFSFDGTAETYARIIQQYASSMSPSLLHQLLIVIRDVRWVAQCLLTDMFYGECREGLHAQVVDRACRGIAAGTLSLLPDIWAASPHSFERDLAKTLAAVGGRESVTRRDIQRKIRGTADSRDRKLTTLALHGMVELDDRRVIRVPMGVRAARIPEIYGFPTPVL